MESQCAFCGIPDKERACKTPEGQGRGPAFCPTLAHPEIIDRAVEVYRSEELGEFSRIASRNERLAYNCDMDADGILRPLKSRLEETIDFCKSMGYQKIGFAFCAGLHKEAAVVAKIFAEHGLDLVSVVCKVGGRDKCQLGLEESDKLCPGSFEPMCSPVAQAEILNQAGTQFNIVMGLCVGHDSLFLAHSKSLCTVLAAKDRLLGHNPLAAVYTHHSYYGFLSQE